VHRIALNFFFDYYMREAAAALELEHHSPGQAKDFEFATLMGFKV
jgi:hypothetical protein